MGDIKRIRKKYQTPMHPWVGPRIEEERKLKRDYGMRNKKELWRMDSRLKSFKDRAKALLAQRDDQARKEERQLLDRMTRLGLLPAGAGFDDILGLSIQNLMDRRLSAVMVKRHLARTMKQARQMVTHRHVMVGGKVVTSPGYLVTVSEEAAIGFAPRSGFADEQHPERFSEEELARKKAKEEARQKKAAKEEDEVVAYDEKAIEEAEVLAGEKKAEKKADEEAEADGKKDEAPKDEEKKPEKKAAPKKETDAKEPEKPVEKPAEDKKAPEKKAEQPAEKAAPKKEEKVEQPAPEKKQEGDA